MTQTPDLEHFATQEAPTDTLPTPLRVGLVAGEGEIPVAVARNLLAKGHPVVVYALDKGNIRAFRTFLPAEAVKFVIPGLAEKNFALLKSDAIQGLVFAGKVNKWSLLKHPLWDARGLRIFNAWRQRNDDAVMLGVIAELEAVGVTVLPQTDYLENLFIPAGLYSRRPPTLEEQADIDYGLLLAKEMGRLDVGQTVVVSHLMAIAIEAIEGTDQAILRARKWVGKKGGVVVKVEKPSQDKRFDVPTVGPRTLKALKKAGLQVLAVEAGKTMVMDLPRMTAMADAWGMTLVAV